MKYVSKIVVMNIVSTLLGILPIIAVFMKLIEPTWAIIIDGALVALTGILTIVFRIWFLNPDPIV